MERFVERHRDRVIGERAAVARRLHVLEQDLFVLRHRLEEWLMANG